MVDNNEIQDTSQQNANPVFNEETAFASENSESSLSPADAFGETLKNIEASEATEQPSQGQPQQPAVQPASNDETRYQYWQSQADKEKNENTHLRNELNQMKGQMNAIAGQQQQAAQQPVQEEMEFPPPPERPQKPGGYNREEAYSDPSSASAQYMDNLENWRDDMDEYNQAKFNYTQVATQERLQQMEERRVQEQRVREARVQQQRQMTQLRQHVATNYSMDETEVNDFVQKMSDPNSISMDNLVQLYRMQQGSGNTTPTQNTGQPSETFQQTQRAQQVPQPMGVQSSSGNVQAPAEDQLMDSLITSYNKNNPWG
tara:strand:- start:1011 stop:1958 length:948 start_codon:yes stop_codon:yes gene_type:complete